MSDYDGDCPVAALTGCFGLFVAGALFLWALLAILPPQNPAHPQAAEKVENPYPQFPLFSVHWELCPQCRSPIINDKGEELGLCEMGFKLLQEDLRARKNVQ